jgi:HAD superfamily hydrolase (TIGR01509 family)
MPEFDSIFFDFDGVLLDSEPVHCACWAEVLKPLGVTLEWEYYRDCCIGIDDRDMLKTMASAADPPRDWQDLWAEYPRKKELFRSRMIGAPPFPATLTGLLEPLGRRYQLAVVSSSSSSEIEPLLEAGGLRRFFQTIVGGGDVTRQKPDPEPYLLAARRLGSKHALVLEDSAAGMASGRAAGFEVIAVGHPTEVPGLVRGRLGAEF